MNFYFDPSSHTYYLNGEKLISVTTILRHAGFFNYYGYDGGMAADRGSAVHAVTELEDKGVLKMEELPNPLSGYIEGWRKFKEDMKIQVLSSEEPVFNPIYKYAGTLDRRILWKGKEAIIDIKSGVSAPWHALQTSAYARCFDRPLLRFCLYLSNDGNYSLEEHRDTTDWDVFRSAVTVVHWKRRKGLIKI